MLLHPIWTLDIHSPNVFIGNFTITLYDMETEGYQRRTRTVAQVLGYWQVDCIEGTRLWKYALPLP